MSDQPRYAVYLMIISWLYSGSLKKNQSFHTHMPNAQGRCYAVFREGIGLLWKFKHTPSKGLIDFLCFIVWLKIEDG